MKRLMLVFVFVVVLSSVAFVVTRQKTPPAANPPGKQTLTDTSPPAVPETPASPRPASRPVADDSAVSPGSRPAPVALPPATAAKTDFERAIDLLVSPHATFEQKWAVWKQLRDAGELDQAITALEKGAANNPAAPEYQTALGEAYINKIPTSTNSQDPAILGLKADQSFDKALSLDPANWEAQFSKAAALSHWPPELNKGEEVIQRLSSLIDQQETMPPQPQFAQTYVLLGEQYQKAGNPDYAEQVWRLGAARFPGDPTLQGKITNPPRQ
ncbi:MAG: hypothetical protein ABSE97_09640 [Verrucomicrobiota bacterium]